MDPSTDTPQCDLLIQARVCPPANARLLGLLFADRDRELITFLESSTDLPNAEDFPSAETLVAVLAVDLRLAVYNLEKVRRFLHKRKLNGDYSTDIRNFTSRPGVQALIPACRKLKPGVTAFIGDSHMATRHFSANASFPILAGSFLESLGVGPYINAGVGGQTSAQGLARYEQDILAHHPVRIIFSFGSNDLSNNIPLETILQNFELMIRPAQARGVTLILGLILPTVPDRLWWSPKPHKRATLEDRRPLQLALLALADRHHAKCLNLLDQMTPAHYCVDGIHLNQSGQERCALETLRLLI